MSKRMSNSNSNSISVAENIQNLETTLLKLRDEILRVEGSIRVFKNLENVGVVSIPVPKKDTTPIVMDETED
jgi:hypothetical protein